MALGASASGEYTLGLEIHFSTRSLMRLPNHTSAMMNRSSFAEGKGIISGDLTDFLLHHHSAAENTPGLHLLISNSSSPLYHKMNHLQTQTLKGDGGAAARAGTPSLQEFECVFVCGCKAAPGSRTGVPHWHSVNPPIFAINI